MGSKNPKFITNAREVYGFVWGFFVSVFVFCFLIKQCCVLWTLFSIPQFFLASFDEKEIIYDHFSHYSQRLSPLGIGRCPTVAVMGGLEQSLMLESLSCIMQEKKSAPLLSDWQVLGSRSLQLPCITAARKQIMPNLCW